MSGIEPSQQQAQDGNSNSSSNASSRLKYIVALLIVAIASVFSMRVEQRERVLEYVATAATSSANRVVGQFLRDKDDDDVAQLMDYRQVIAQSFDRFDAVVRAGIGPALVAERQKKFYLVDDGNDRPPMAPLPPPIVPTTTFSAQDCITASLTCGLSCGHINEKKDEACWCIRIAVDQREVAISYLPKEKTESPNERRNLTEWKYPSFLNLQLQLNVLQIAMDRWVATPSETNETVPSLMYLVLNTLAFPRQFVPYHDSQKHLPPMPPQGYPPSEAIMGNSASHFSAIASWRNMAGMPNTLNPCIKPPFENPPCCNVGRGTWIFTESIPLNTIPHGSTPMNYTGMDYRPIPIFSTAMNPQYNFDILVPSRLQINCQGPVLEGVPKNEKRKEQDNNAADAAFMPARIPWHRKTRSIAFPNERGMRDCYRGGQYHYSQHILRFCSKLLTDFSSYEKEKQLRLHVGTPMEAKELASHRMIVLVDGMLGDAAITAEMRNVWLYTLGSVLIVSGIHLDVRLALLKPHVHYLPFVANNMTSFWEAVEWVVTHDDEAQRMAQRLQRAAMTFLSGRPRRKGQVAKGQERVLKADESKNKGEDHEQKKRQMPEQRLSKKKKKKKVSRDKQKKKQRKKEKQEQKEQRQEDQEKKESRSKSANQETDADANADEWSDYVFDGGHHFDVVYWMEVLRQYSQRFSFEPEESLLTRAGFTMNRQCLNFRLVFNEGERSCLHPDYACGDTTKKSMDPQTRQFNSRVVQHGVHPRLVLGSDDEIVDVTVDS